MCLPELLNHLGDGKLFSNIIVTADHLLNHLGDGKLQSFERTEWQALLNHLGDGKLIHDYDEYGR